MGCPVRVALGQDADHLFLVQAQPGTEEDCHVLGIRHIPCVGPQGRDLAVRGQEQAIAVKDLAAGFVQGHLPDMHLFLLGQGEMRGQVQLGQTDGHDGKGQQKRPHDETHAGALCW